VATADRRRGVRPEAAPEPPGDDELFVCPPSGFVEARNALARRLRAQGDREAAAEVSRLRRPTQSVWALNQTARQEAALVEALGDAGQALRAATENALAGDASALRPAQEAERVTVDRVVAAAEAHLAAVGEPANPVIHQRMVDTLRATSTDPHAAAHLHAGRLTEDLTAAGLGLDGFSASPAPLTRIQRARSSGAKPSGAKPSGATSSAARAETRQNEVAKARWAKLDRAARQLEAEATSLEHDAQEARQQAERAVAAGADAERAAARAGERARQARARADAVTPQ
jgi:hypothetical protein